MTYVLDTHAFSALMKGAPAAVARLAAVDRAAVAVPQPVLAEIEYGLARLPASKRRTNLRARFELLVAEIPRASWTDAVSAAYGEIKATLERRGRRIEDVDAAIAAHALAIDGTLVTAGYTRRRQVSRALRKTRTQPFLLYSGGIVTSASVTAVSIDRYSRDTVRIVTRWSEASPTIRRFDPPPASR